MVWVTGKWHKHNKSNGEGGKKLAAGDEGKVLGKHKERGVEKRG